MIEAYLSGVSSLPPGCAPSSTVVLGPEMPARRRSALLSRFGHLADVVTFLDFEPDFALLLAQADVVVSMAGYNTVCELLLFGRRAVLVPRAEPVQEQLIRARLFAARGVFDIVEPQELTPDVLLSKVLAGLAKPPHPDPLPEGEGVDFGGLPRIRERVHALLAPELASVG
jgi:predicted glycosyltransferase